MRSVSHVFYLVGDAMQKNIDTKKNDVKIKKGSFERQENEKNERSKNERDGSQASEYLDDGAPRWTDSNQNDLRRNGETGHEEYLGGEKITEPNRSSSGSQKSAQPQRDQNQSQENGMDKCFEGLRFPAEKKQILEHVRRKQASQDLIAGVERLKENCYRTSAEITREISH